MFSIRLALCDSHASTIFFARWIFSARYTRECPQRGSDGQQIALLFYSQPQVAAQLGNDFLGLPLQS
jgi:hypothetical protein